MKLFYAPGACSIGVHALLEETGKPFEAVRLNLSEGDQRKPDYVALNPKGKVPALTRDDGSLLTEFPAIAWWIGAAHPELNLIPASINDQAKAISVMSYIAGFVHPQGFTRLFRPNYFTSNEAEYDAVRALGADNANKGIALLSDELGDADHVAGALSIADYALFYVCWWKAFRLKEELPANLAAHYERMMARPAVKRALAREGFAAQARKELARKHKEEQAARNRASFGRSKAEKEREAAITDLGERRLDSHRRERAEDDGETPA
ncbi:glutathione S-transferase family protein [Ostertagia ostertagi]